MSAPLAVFRCDASPRIGAGHVMRCLALAEMLGDAGWRVLFAVGSETVSIATTLAASGFGIHVINDANHEPELLGEAAAGQADLLVVDHYERDAPFERKCRSFARKVMVLDDATGRDHDCDILVDAAAGTAEPYSGHVPASTRVLTGSGYALVRRSFA